MDMQAAIRAVTERRDLNADEIASLARSFNRMQRSLTNAVDMINDTMDGTTRMG